MAVDDNGNEINNELSESEKRFKGLSDKVKTASEERDAERAAKEAAETAKVEVERERDFYQGFSEVVATNPSAKEHKDDILAKVKSGYTVEDATFAVLGKAGKLGQPKVETQVAGGSAVANLPPQGATKSVKEMSVDERATAFRDAVNRGDIALS